MAEQHIDGAVATFLATRPVARLATADVTGRPHVVPVCFAWDGATIWIALDAKPKRHDDVLRLRRVRNIIARPHVALIIDDYLNAWDQLAYVLVEGSARLVAPTAPEHMPAIALLRTKYPQYAAMPIDERPVIAITPEHVVSWGAVASRAERPATLEAIIPGRRSVRRFAATPVPHDAISRILDAARWAPSPHGRQPWRFAVITQPALKERLAVAMGDEWQATLAQDGEPLEVVTNRLVMSQTRIRTAPVIIIPCLYLDDLDHYPDAQRQAAEATMAVQSLGAAVQNMLLTAYHTGLDMGWMCAPLFCGDVVQQALELPASWVPHALLPLGYAAVAPKRRPHRPADDLTWWDGHVMPR